MQNNNVVMIQLDKMRSLRYGHKALKTLSALTGKGLESLSGGKFDLNELEKILYCGLLSDSREKGEELKLEDMEDIIDSAESFQYVIEKMTEAFEVSFGKTVEVNAGAGKSRKK